MAVASTGPFAPRSSQITTPAPHHSFFTGRMLFLGPNQVRHITEGQNTLLEKENSNFGGQVSAPSQHLRCRLRLLSLSTPLCGLGDGPGFFDALLCTKRDCACGRHMCISGLPNASRPLSRCITNGVRRHSILVKKPSRR